ncbi:gamma-glutamyltranspeptidase/glutathione hydrolase [Microbacterium sp. AG157]|uniref:gamma-glutamyltransferase family protein n=1 Tax=Microbacterium sp. AG157 TaxID=2183993 RepID=UPI000E24BA19|nr:gamma-glutamyltransferase [Microbacterium sp. AG157]REC97362.1 gamma-glutamyltranspeptidase/glutathione hydrolase [Microbacterium sp. AG157]
MTFTPPASFTTRPTLRGTFGMSASTHWTATATAQAVLERGGNAFDAACAAGFVLHVVEPHLNGPGGDLVALVRPAGASEPSVLMGQGPAPAAATLEHFHGRGLDLVPGAGGLAATVPGGVDAWLLLLRDHGTWELGDVLAFATRYARDGHPLVAGAAATIGRVADLFRAHWSSSKDRWMPTGEPPAPDTVVRNPAWADVLDSLTAAGTGAIDRESRIDAAREHWMTEVLPRAATFLREPHRHADGRDHPGILDAEDLASWRATFEPAVSVSFRGWDVFKAGAWSQGPALLQTLRLIEDADDVDPGSADGAHLLLEAQKLAYADRDAWFGDTDDAVSVEALLTDEYIAARRALLGADASLDLRPGSPDGREPVLPALRTTHAVASGSTGEPTVDRSGQTRGDTCHLDVIDRWGNAISATPSGGWLQSSPTIPELGFCLGTRLQMVWLEPGHPASLVPGRRPRTTLTPTLLTRGDEVIAIGSPGGDQQDQWQLPVLVRMLVGGYSPQQAIDAPTLHTTALVDSFWPRTWSPAGAVVEDRLGDDLIAELERRGHRVRRAGDWALGRVSAVGRDAEGLLWAAANPRGAQGYAAGR